jgi:hypothetical protein
MIAREEGQGMGNNGTSFSVIVGGGSDRLIQASQGQLRPVAAQGRGAQRAGPIKQQRWVPPDGWGDDLDDVVIKESNARQRRQNQEDNQIGS